MTTAREQLQWLSQLLEKGDPAARADGLRWLATRSGVELAHLDDNARTHSWDGPALGGTPDPDESTGLGTALASMHADGRRRERAVASIYRAGAELGTALLALRCADHIEHVAAAAQRSLLKAPDSLTALGVLVTRARRISSREMLARYAASCSPELLRSSDNRALRRWSFENALATESLSLDELMEGAEDNDQWIRTRYADPLAKLAAEVDPAFLRTLLTSRYVETRLAAITYLPDELLDPKAPSLNLEAPLDPEAPSLDPEAPMLDPEAPSLDLDAPLLDLETALLDPAARVRAAAQWRCRRQKGDPAEVYRRQADAEVLRTATTARAGATVAGLAETGDATDLALVQPLLADPRRVVRAQAVKAVANWLSPAERPAVLGPLLLDPTATVAKAAAKALGGAPGAAGPAAIAWSSPHPWSRRAALRLLNWDGRWSAVEANLRAMLDSDPDVAALGRYLLGVWLTRGSAQGRPLPDEAQRDRLRELLPTADLDQAALHTISLLARL